MKQKRIFLVSVLVSLLVHFLLIGASYFLWVPGVEGLTEQTYKMFDVKSVDLGKRELTRQTIRQGRVESLRFEKPAEGMGKMLKDPALDPEALEIPQTSPSALSPQPDLAPTPDKLPTAPEMLARFKENIQIEARNAVSLPKAAAPDMLRPEVNLSETSQEMEIPEEFFETRPSFTPEKVMPRTASASSARPAALAMPDNLDFLHAFKPDPRHEPLDQFLSVQLYTYTDPGDGQKYFQLSIYPAFDTEQLEVMPKEIIFLLDASLSIRGRRLQGFKEGIKYALMNLNPNDRFNIYVFKNTIIPFSEASIPASPSAISQAIYFLDGVQASRTTDIYEAFLQTVQQPAAIDPSYIVLLSDGKPTEGVKSSVKLISHITRINDREKPLFTVSGGARVDRFLLDFLAYPNRGWSEYAGTDQLIQTRMVDLYDKIRNPILVNVRYQITPLQPEEIFPAHLPDFYRDTVFTLYGKYTADTKFSIRLLGEIEDTTKEFILTYDLAMASPGSNEIARFWAFNKIYDMISRMTLEGGASPGDKEEIKSLIQRFDLQIPYDFDKIL